MSKIRKTYTKAEKLEIVSKSLEEGQSVKDLALHFGISENTIYNWRKLYAKYKDASFSGKGNKTMTESEREIAALKKELKERRLEVEILKKAVHIFSNTERKFTSL